MKRISTNLLRAQILAPYARLLRRKNAPPEQLFSSFGIPLEAVFDPEAMITMCQAHRFAEEAARYTGEEALGSLVGRQLNLDELGASGFAVKQSATFFDASSAIRKTVQSAEPGSKLWIEPDGARSWFCYRPERRFTGGIQSELFDLQCLLKFVQLGAGIAWRPAAIKVTTESSDLLQREPEFSDAPAARNDRTTAIAFPTEFLSRPLAGASRIRKTVGEAGYADETETESLNVASAVSALLASLAPFEPIPSLNQMADRFGVTGRTLQRALADCDTSYRQLSERVMYHRASKLLLDEGLPVKRIAAELGYATPNSFIRAFRRIAGVTPVVYRGRHSQPR